MTEVSWQFNRWLTDGLWKVVNQKVQNKSKIQQVATS